jgi:hypothetical protein
MVLSFAPVAAKPQWHEAESIRQQRKNLIAPRIVSKMNGDVQGKWLESKRLFGKPLTLLGAALRFSNRCFCTRFIFEICSKDS